MLPFQLEGLKLSFYCLRESSTVWTIRCYYRLLRAFCEDTLPGSFVLHILPWISKAGCDWLYEKHKGAILSETSSDLHSVYEPVTHTLAAVAMSTVWCCVLQQTRSNLPPAECYFCILLLFTSQPFPHLLLDLLGSLGPSVPPLHTQAHAHINTNHTNTDTLASCLLHGPC